MRYITLLLLFLSMTLPAQPKVIAHRGYWDCEGSAQNSLASLIKAQEIGVYGSEFDVWITADGVAVLNHDAAYQGVVIETSKYDDLQGLRLKNGEPIPTLEQYFEQGIKYPEVKLILELKVHSSAENEERAIAEVVRLVEKYGFFENIPEGGSPQIEFISFSFSTCQKFAKAFPTAEVAYLRGDISPKKVKRGGVPAIDYNHIIISNNSHWVKQAHRHDMKVNVWTVNSEFLIKAMIKEGVDFITTDNPVVALEICKK